MCVLPNSPPVFSSNSVVAMKCLIGESRASVSENSPTRSAFSAASISVSSPSFCSALALTTRPPRNSSSTPVIRDPYM